MDRIEAMRKWRVRVGPDLSIAAEAAMIAREFTKGQKHVAAGEGAVDQSMPPQLRALVLSVRLARGMLTLRATDAGAAYVIDRWLRSGGEAILRKAAKGVRAVRVSH